MVRADFSDLADADFRRIWMEGAERWGPEQADRYTDALYDLVQHLAEAPGMARVRTEFSRPVRIHPFRSHLVAFRERESGGIEVIRILHGHSDLDAAFDD